MKIFLRTILLSLSFLFLSTQVTAHGHVYADNSNCGSSSNINYSCLPQNVTGTVESQHHTIEVILNMVFAIVGSIATLIIILSGFRFITSSGKPEEVARAKDTIIYAAVGLVVCIFAVTIVSFVAGFI
jgi:hypothetical protein